MRSQYIRLLLLLLAMLTISACIRKDVSKYTTPLPHETVQDICQKFELDDNLHCQKGQIVYAPDFFSFILASFEREVSTREDVQAKLGQYEYGCDDPIYVPSLDNTYYWCSYDLNGDKVFPIGIRYDVVKNRDIVSGMVATIGDN